MPMDVEQRARATDAMDDAKFRGVAGLGGAAVAAHYARPLVTGRTPLYHGTTPEFAAKIREHGVLPRTATGVRGVTEILPGEIGEASKGMAFLTRGRTDARGYSAQARRIAKILERHPEAGMQETAMAAGFHPLTLINSMNPFYNKGMVKADVPLWKKEIAEKLRRNPEARKNIFQFMDEAVSPVALVNNPVGAALSYKGYAQAKAFEGGLGPEYVRGSAKYIPHSMREFREYAQKHPGRLAAGIGIGAVGLGAAGYGGKKLVEYVKRRRALAKDSALPKAASVEGLAMYKSMVDELDKIAFEETAQEYAGHFAKVATALTYKARENLSSGAFVFPKERRYPIHDEAHARNALARSSGKPEESKVRAAVHAKYPGIGKSAAVQNSKTAAAAVKKATITKLALKDEKDEWSKPNLNWAQRHKKALGAGLALATSAGVGYKLLKKPVGDAVRRSDIFNKLKNPEAFKKSFKIQPGGTLHATPRPTAEQKKVHSIIANRDFGEKDGKLTETFRRPRSERLALPPPTGKPTHGRDARRLSAPAPRPAAPTKAQKERPKKPQRRKVTNVAVPGDFMNPGLSPPEKLTRAERRAMKFRDRKRE